MDEIAKAQEYINGYIDRARKAQAEFEKMSQEKWNEACKVLAKTVADNAEMLAELAVEETKMGNVKDKTAKNLQKSKIIYNNIKDKKTKGIIERDEKTGITKVAKPVGVVAAITPVTNPIVTPMSNSMFALKCGNAIIITSHHSAVKSSGKTVEMIRENLEKAGFPKDIVQMIDEHSRANTSALISSADIVIATGGAGMVGAAYSSGRPALGVGAGNVQCIIDEGYDYKEAVPKIILGRGYDYGIICSGEQSVICPEGEFDNIMEEFKKNKAMVITDGADLQKIRDALFRDGKVNRASVGVSPQKIGELAGINVPEDTSIIVVKAEGTGLHDPLGGEKMAPVLAAYSYKNLDEGIEIAKENLEKDGKGHTVAIHSDNEQNIEHIAVELSASRFVVNQASANSAGGSFFNGLAPTNTLGCGTWGHNSISENLDYKHLMNITRIAHYMKDNKVPTDDELWA